MSRALFCSLGGAAAGFFAGQLGVSILAGGQPATDAVAIAFFVGCFLAGAGAIAGAVIGGVADLREYMTRKDQSPQDAPYRDK